jgi:hypothetical protein
MKIPSGGKGVKMPVIRNFPADPASAICSGPEGREK